MTSEEIEKVTQTINEALRGHASDPAWLSLFIGRLGAALGAGTVVYAAGSSVWQQVQTLVANGATMDEAIEVVKQVGLLMNSADLMTAAVGAVIALVWPLVSKYRESRKSRL